MGKNGEASLFERFVIMIFGLGVVLVGAYPFTKKHGGIKKYVEKKFNEGKEVNFKDIFSFEKGAEYTGSKSSSVAAKSESSRAIFWAVPKEDQNNAGKLSRDKEAVRQEIEKKQRINKAEDHLTKSDRQELDSLLDKVPD